MTHPNRGHYSLERLDRMLPTYATPLVIGVVLFVSAEFMVYGRRFGPVTDVAKSSDTGGIAFRALGLLFIGVGVYKFLQTVFPGL